MKHMCSHKKAAIMRALTKKNIETTEQNEKIIETAQEIQDHIVEKREHYEDYIDDVKNAWENIADHLKGKKDAHVD